jgi:hydrogenase expression/formation protein HypD
MKYVDEYRDAQRLQARLQDVQKRCNRRWTIMDVCGGQTHNLLRHGVEQALSETVELIHGPGCPVCVTPAEVIDDAIQLALQHHVIIASFGDMLRVPGRTGSLLQARAHGGDIRTVYGPSDAVDLAQRHPDRDVVFLAVGFETTVPSTALAVLQAEQRQTANFSVLAHHVRVEPAMRALVADPDCRIDGFLAAGHVCTVTGYEDLEPLAKEFRLPVVVTGFEPVDLVDGLLACIDQLEAGRAAVENRYPRCVRRAGNPAARRLIERVFSVCDLPWRGFGALPHGGFALRPEYARFDARRRLDVAALQRDGVDDDARRCAAVLAGRIKPPQCPLFGSACTPDAPRGAPMVSSEGACAAYYRYARSLEAMHV